MSVYRSAGLRTRPVLLGPVSFLLLSKVTDGSDPLDLLEAVLPSYARILAELAEAGCAWVQMDEPFPVLDIPGKAHEGFNSPMGRWRAAHCRTCCWRATSVRSATICALS